jgi:hypothetical protein
MKKANQGIILFCDQNLRGKYVMFSICCNLKIFKNEKYFIFTSCLTVTKESCRTDVSESAPRSCTVRAMNKGLKI